MLISTTTLEAVLTTHTNNIRGSLSLAIMNGGGKLPSDESRRAWRLLIEATVVLWTSGNNELEMKYSPNNATSR